MIAEQQNFIYTFQMNYTLMCVNNIISNVYVYQFWENLGTMGVSSRTSNITVIYKKGDKEDIAN